MINKFPVLFLLLVLNSCGHYLTAPNLVEKTTSRSIASTIESISVYPIVSTITVCQKKYSLLNWTTNHPNFIIESKIISKNRERKFISGFDHDMKS